MTTSPGQWNSDGEKLTLESSPEKVQETSVEPSDPPEVGISPQAVSLADPVVVMAEEIHGIADDPIFGEYLYPAPPPMPGFHGFHGHGQESTKEVERGSKTEVKQLYEGPRKCECCINWVETPPRGAEKEHVTKAKWGEYAVVVHKTAHGGDQAWKLHSVVINSRYILDILRKHLAKYPGLAIEVDEVHFSPPFAPLLHFWPEILESANATEDQDTSDHFELFKTVMEPELEEPLKKAQDCSKLGKMEFGYLWTLFKPGSLIYWQQDGQDNIGRLQTTANRVAMGSPYFELKADQVNFDGKQFGYEDAYRTIGYFEGFKSISEFPIPLDMRSDRDAILKNLVERGKRFENLQGFHFKAYSGKASVDSASGMWGLGSSDQIITSRVIVDAATYYSSEGRAPRLHRLKETNVEVKGPKPVKRRHADPHGSYEYAHPPPAFDRNDFSYADQDYGHVGRRPRRGSLREDNAPPIDLTPLSQDELVLCVSHVRGFVLQTKEWGTLNVDGITEIAWENTFENLVLPNQVKDLLLAFAKSKMRGDALFDDFVGGKGKGIIMLLSGPPGVGKTLTAEAIAEKLKVPVYTLSAGELGSVAANVESALVSAMTKCARWNAVLLLDECDVFLEKRELNSLKRNELVSIFLRLVEYYEGIMLLTTNRISTIDPAFESRVDVAIAYDDLTAPLRQQIWENFLFKLHGDGAEVDADSLTDAALRGLAEHELNGRQIKSVIKTAQLLARSKEQALGMGHLNAVLALNQGRGKVA